ncbi:MAG TPA: MarR family winged helix-turn-helix transcriptional regulator, partial [Gaiellaceae bacterium]|nr:MarR family winged helix-turn-helix transcriptional regulator [Gaiellaceae bacterium]
LAQRENRHLVYERLASVANIDVTPGEAWLLLRVNQVDATSAEELAARYKLDADTVARQLDDLRAQGLVEGSLQMRLTESGHTAVEKMAEARQEALQRFLEEWQPEQHPEVVQLLERFARSLRAMPPAGDPVPA